MGSPSYMVRKGLAVRTARWVAVQFWQTVNNRELNLDNLSSQVGFDKEIDKVISNALDFLFQGNKTHPDIKKIEVFYSKLYGPGLAGFVKSVLGAEARYSENTIENIAMFDEIINEELTDAGVGPSMITGRLAV